MQPTGCALFFSVLQISMDKIATSSITDRQELFQETANRRGIAPAIVEKDFWVCWTLKHVFGLPVAQHLLFKGGTSLSKVFGVIGRFSEDVDLSIHRDHLGFGGDNDPEQIAGKNKRKEAIEGLQTACIINIRDEFLPLLEASFDSVLRHSNDWTLRLDERDPQAIFFTYPHGLDTDGLLPYIQPVVKLELGARSDPYPTGDHEIMSYAAEEFPDEFGQSACSVKVLDAERTFWEKATILHAEFHRPADKETPDRISRHYSDLAQLAGTEIANRALANLGLLDRVAIHKSIYFASSWARYADAKPGTLCLLPSSERRAKLERDYERMRDMFFGDRPTFNQVLSALKNLENRVNEVGA